jgi:hypothetical protein
MTADRIAGLVKLELVYSPWLSRKRPGVPVMNRAIKAFLEHGEDM